MEAKPHMDDANRIVATAASSIAQVPIEAIYFLINQVTSVLAIVFGFEVGRAKRESISFISSILDDSSREEGLFFLHLTPLQIAADIAKASDRALTEEEAERYRAMTTNDFEGVSFLRYA